eukprot:3841733-Amphidinium_carterae.1
MMVPLELQLVAFMHFVFYLSATRFQYRHVSQNAMQKTLPPRRAGFRLAHHGSARVYRLWIVVCVLTSAWAQKRSSTVCPVPLEQISWSVFQTLASPEIAISFCMSALSLNN